MAVDLSLLLHHQVCNITPRMVLDSPIIHTCGNKGLLQRILSRMAVILDDTTILIILARYSILFRPGDMENGDKSANLGPGINETEDK